MSKYSHNVVDNKHHNTPWYKIMQWIGEKPRVLDVGCSSGYFGEKLIAGRHALVWGIELDADDAAAARKRGYQEVFEGDLDNFDWGRLKSLEFDAIIFADVLEHIKDPSGTLKAAKKLLSKNGCIYASIPNIAHMSVRLELLEGNFDYESTGLLDNTHIRFFTLKTIHKTLKDAGLHLRRLDATYNDNVPGQIKAHVKKLGLEPQPAFDDLLDSPASRTFQYIIEAGVNPPSKAIDVPSFSSKLHDEWPKIEKKMHEDFRLISDLQKKLEQQVADNKNLRTALKERDERLAYMRKHPVKWAAHGAYKRIARK